MWSRFIYDQYANIKKRSWVKLPHHGGGEGSFSAEERKDSISWGALSKVYYGSHVSKMELKQYKCGKQKKRADV